jgi:DNA gyrase subunit A
LIERIADLARENKIEGIVDLRDESDRQGMRIVIELTKSADPEQVLAGLYKYTQMQNTLSIIMLALVKGEPRLLSLKQALRTYIEHRIEIVKRRSEFELDKADKRLHVIEGLRIAIQNLDEIISLIRRASDSETAQKRLIRKYRLSVIQAQAILDMPLRRLSALERKKLEEEFRNVTALIKRLKALLKSERKMRAVVSDKLHDIREKYGDRRRTQLAELSTKSKEKLSLTTRDLTPEKSIWILVTKQGLISRTIQNKLPRLSGSEAPHWIIKASTRDTLYLVLGDGKTASIPAHQVPETEKATKGVPFHEISSLQSRDNIACIFTIPPRTTQKKSLPGFDEWFVLTATRKGYVKKTLVSSLPGASAEPFTLVKVNDDDILIGVRLTNGEKDVLLVSSMGMSIRFKESEIRPMGLVAAGVMGMKLRGEDEVVALDVLPQQGEVFLVTSGGRAKRTKLAQFPEQGRYGQGVVAWKVIESEKVVGMVIGKGSKKAALVLNKLLPKAIRLDEAPVQGRTARGKEIIQLKPGDQVRSLCVPWDVPRLGTIKKRQR